jgi:hypothetical protein
MTNNQKKYTEEQYKKYCEFNSAIANADDMVKGAWIFCDMEDWIYNEHLSSQAIEQMDQRMEIEDSEEMIKNND